MEGCECSKGMSILRGEDVLYRVKDTRRVEVERGGYACISEVEVGVEDEAVNGYLKRRMSVEEALSHPYVAAYHDAEDEPAAPSIDPEYFEFEGE